MPMTEFLTNYFKDQNTNREQKRADQQLQLQKEQLAQVIANQQASQQLAQQQLTQQISEQADRMKIHQDQKAQQDAQFQFTQALEVGKGVASGTMRQMPNLPGAALPPLKPGEFVSGGGFVAPVDPTDQLANKVTSEIDAQKRLSQSKLDEFNQLIPQLRANGVDFSDEDLQKLQVANIFGQTGLNALAGDKGLEPWITEKLGAAYDAVRKRVGSDPGVLQDPEFMGFVNAVGNLMSKVKPPPAVYTAGAKAAEGAQERTRASTNIQILQNLVDNAKLDPNAMDIGTSLGRIRAEAARVLGSDFDEDTAKEFFNSWVKTNKPRSLTGDIMTPRTAPQNILPPKPR